MIDEEVALERVMAEGDEWRAWRALRLSGDDPGPLVDIPDQDELGAFIASGRQSPGATGAALCHLAVLGLAESAPAVIAADWLESARTPAQAWLDAPSSFPGYLDDPGGARVWATASAACGLLALSRDPGERALDLLRGEADQQGRLTGGGYPTFAAAGAYWRAHGPKTEMTEWALRWAREEIEEWDELELTDALVYWRAAGIPREHPSVESFSERLRSVAPPEGWGEIELTLRTLEVLFDAG